MNVITMHCLHITYHSFFFFAKMALFTEQLHYLGGRSQARCRRDGLPSDSSIALMFSAFWSPLAVSPGHRDATPDSCIIIRAEHGAAQRTPYVIGTGSPSLGRQTLNRPGWQSRETVQTSMSVT